MSDFIESLFQGVDILIDKKLENIAYDTTEVCTIVDSSDRKNGKYRVTNGSVSYIAYSDNDKFREGDQVRVTIPNGDFSQKKFILGKYVTDEESSPITYISPLESVVNISGNLLGSKGSEEYGILANGPEKSKLIWKQSLSAEQFRNLQDSNVYNILILKADFKTLLYNYKYIEGSYGLLVELLVRPSVDSSAKIRRVITLDSSEMFGNPYNFAIYATQAKTINIVTVGVIEEIALHLYQKGDFKNDRQEYIAPPSGDVANNILIKNIELGFGSDLTEVEDNVVRIYSENSLLYNYYPHSAATNLKKIGLVWYNKDEDNQYIGFSDGIYQPDYDELTYLEESATDTRLIEQKGKENIPPDETGLTFAANIAEAEPILQKISSMLTSDLYSLLLAFKQAASGDLLLTEVIDTLLLDIQSIAASLSTDASSLIPTLKKLYENILKYVYDTRNNLNVTKPTPTNIYLNIFKKISNKLDLSDITVPQEGWLGWILTAIKNRVPSSGYQEVKDNYLFRIERILSEIEKLINSLPEEMKDDYEKFSDYLDTGATKDPYGEKDYSNYGSKYCIYWYKYEEGYKDDSDGIKLMPDGWRRIINPQGGPNEGDPYIPLPSKYLDANGNSILNDAGKELHAPVMTNNQGFIYEYMENESVEQKYVAIVCYDHGIYKSNELVFKNSQEVPDKSLLDKTDAIKFIHKENSSDSYQIYSELYYLRDSADEFREREIQCKYDGLLAKDDALKNAQIYWYVPLNSTMITYDIDFLKEKGFDSDASKQMSYSKEGYICFYKQIKWDEDYGFGASIDNRSFWYKIKSYLEPSATQNHIICSVVPYAQEVKVDGTQFFTFGKSGSNGTKYTFTITNATSQSAAANGKPLPLILSLRDSNNQLVDFTINSSNFLSWMMHTLNDIGSEANIGYGEFNNKIQNFNISTSGGCGILQANTSVKIPSKAENATEENARTVQLNCLAAVPWSKEYHYYISGPTYVIYNNYGTLDSTSMFNTPYKLFDGRTHKELLVDWYIEYYIKNGTGGKWEKVTTEENIYKGYMPELDDNGALVPPTLYVDNVNCVPVVVATYGSDVYWRQPIIIIQNRYPSFLLNDWDGELRIDEEGNTILSALLGAGRKNANNTFDGVLMGNVDAAAGISDGIGLYGFHQGAQSFGFKIDGTAFLGKAGKGRILFDGNYGFIASANWFTGKDATDSDTGGLIDTDGTIARPSDAGLCINLQDGHIDAFNFKLTSENINFNSNPGNDENYMKIGNDTSGYIQLSKTGDLTIAVNNLSLHGTQVDQMMDDKVSSAIGSLDLTMTQDEIFNILFDDGQGGVMDGIEFRTIEGKKQLYISATYIGAGVLVSQNYDAFEPQGMYINLTSGTIWTPYFYLDEAGKITATDGSFTGYIDADEGFVGSWIIDGDRLSSENSKYVAYIQTPNIPESGDPLTWVYSIQEKRNGESYGVFYADVGGNVFAEGDIETESDINVGGDINAVGKFNNYITAGCPSNLNRHIDFYPYEWDFGIDSDFVMRDTISSTGGFVINAGDKNKEESGKHALYLLCSSLYFFNGLPAGGIGLNSDGKVIQSGTSSLRYKENIREDFDEELNPENLYKIPVKQFNYKDECKDITFNPNTQVGLIAEDVALYFPSASFSKNGVVEGWNERMLIPAMLKLIQNQKQALDDLEEKYQLLQNILTSENQ